MWVRLWFDSAGAPHQRAYTLLDPNPSTGTFSMEFALHEGRASEWARAARPGDTIEATVQGTGFTVPHSLPSRLLVIGDPASLPAINSLLDSMPLTPATIWFETPHPADEQLPLRSGTARHEVRHVPRRDNGALLIETVRSALLAHLDDRLLRLDRVRHIDDPGPRLVRAQATRRTQSAVALHGLLARHLTPSHLPVAPSPT